MTMTKVKMTMLAVVALALAIALPAFAQDTTQPSTPANPSTGQQTNQSGSQPMQQPEMSAPTQPDPGAAVSGTNPQTSDGSQTLSGTISADGKTFNSSGTTYTISNPNSVKAYANQPITVGYEMASNNSIRITKVMLTKPQQ